MSYLAAPSFSSAGCDVFIAPQPSEEELQVPCCHPYGVRAMWSERSRLRRLGTAPGSLEKVAVALLALLLSRLELHRNLGVGLLLLYVFYLVTVIHDGMTRIARPPE